MCSSDLDVKMSLSSTSGTLTKALKVKTASKIPPVNADYAQLDEILSNSGDITTYEKQPECRHYFSNTECTYKVTVKLIGNDWKLLPGQATALYLRVDEGFFVDTSANTNKMSAVTGTSYPLRSAANVNMPEEADLSQPFVLPVGHVSTAEVGDKAGSVDKAGKVSVFFSENVVLDSIANLKVKNLATNAELTCAAATITCVVERNRLDISNTDAAGWGDNISWKITLVNNADLIKDLSGNSLYRPATDIDLFFRSFVVDNQADLSLEDSNVPATHQLYPKHGASEVNPKTAFAVQFKGVSNADMALTAGKFVTIYQNVNTAADCVAANQVHKFSVGTDLHLLDSNTITFSLPNDAMGIKIKYSVVIDAGLVKDSLSKTNVATACNAWTFTTSCKNPTQFTAADKWASAGDSAPFLLGWAHSSQRSDAVGLDGLLSSSTTDLKFYFSEPVTATANADTGFKYGENLKYSTHMSGSTNANIVTVRVQSAPAAQTQLTYTAGAFQSAAGAVNSLTDTRTFKIQAKSAVPNGDAAPKKAVDAWFKAGTKFPKQLSSASVNNWSTFMDTTGADVTQVAAYHGIWFAATADPAFTALPFPGQSQVAPSSALVVAFTENIIRGSASANVKLGSHTYTFAEHLNTNLFINGKFLYIVPHKDLVSGLQTVVVGSGLVYDAQRQPNQSFQWSFTVVAKDLTGPELTLNSVVPAQTAGLVVNRRIAVKLVFNENVQGTGAGFTVDDVAVDNNDLIAFRGKEVFLAPRDRAADIGNVVTIKWTAAAVKDVAGNAMQTPTNKIVYTAMKENTDAPSVVLQSPAHNDAKVGPRASIHMLLSKSVRQKIGAGIKVGGQTVLLDNSQPHVGTAIISGKRVYVSLVDSFPLGQTVSVSDLTGVVDEAGNAAVTLPAWTFTVDALKFGDVTVAQTVPARSDAGLLHFADKLYWLGGKGASAPRTNTMGLWSSGTDA